MLRTKLFMLTVIAGCIATAGSAEARSYGRWCGAGSDTDFSVVPIDRLDAICRAHDACCQVHGFKDRLGGKLVQCTSFCNIALRWNFRQYRKKHCKRLKNKFKKRCRSALIGSIYTSIGNKKASRSLRRLFRRPKQPKPNNCVLAKMQSLNDFSEDRVEWPYGPQLKGNPKQVFKRCK